MLRSSHLYKNLSKLSFTTTPSRSYKYQAEIYTNKFETSDDALKNDLKDANQHRVSQPNLYRFINAYHQYGFKKAKLDPLNQMNNQENYISELDPATYGLGKDAATSYPIQGLLFNSKCQEMTVEQIDAYLTSTYSSNIAIEFEFLTSEEEKLWLAKEFELMQQETIENRIKIDLLKLLQKSQVNYT